MSKSIKIGYVPYSSLFERPGDKRRFVFYAKKRNLIFEIADPQINYDLVILTQNADLSIWTKYKKYNSNTKIIYDAIDSYLSIPHSDIKGIFRGIAKFLTGQSKHLQLSHWKAITKLCSQADSVVCSTQEQYIQLKKYCNNVHINLDAHVEVARNFKKNYNTSNPFRLVWEGLPENLLGIKKILYVLNEIEKIYPIELNIITDKFYYKYLGKFGKTHSIKIAQSLTKNVKFHEWNENNLSEKISDCDLAIIPLNLEDRFASGKPENKLLLFWRLGIPVVTSATPAYIRAMDFAGNKNYAYNNDEWYSLIINMIENKEFRESSAQNGKKYVEYNYSESKIIERWDLIFQSVGFNFN